MSYTTILQLLDTQLLTTTDLPTHYTENERVQLITDTPWCRSTLLPVETQELTIGSNGWVKVQGLYQIDLFYPNDAGYSTAAGIADNVITSFARGLSLGTTTIVKIEMSWRLPARSFQQFYQIPVSVRWASYQYTS